MAEPTVNIDVLFIGQTGVGKSTLINMIRRVKDNAATAATVSNGRYPCTLHSTAYSLQLGAGLHCQLWDTRGLDETVDQRDRFMAKIVHKIRQLAFQQERELRELVRQRSSMAKPILMWCIDASKIDVPIHWQQFHKVYVEYCEENAIPVVVITRMSPSMTGWEAKCINQLQFLGLRTGSGNREVMLLRVRKHRNTYSREYTEDCDALRDLIFRLMTHSNVPS